jgi:hypothetical protein
MKPYSALDTISDAVPDLPVVPTCRTPARLPPTPDTLHLRRHPAPTRRGVSRSSRNVGREAMDAKRALDESALSRTAKPCGPDAATLASSSREASFLGMTVAKKPVHRGELGISRKTIAQGMPDPFGEPVVTYLRAFHFRTRGCGCIAHPAFPAPSDSQEGTKGKPRADRQRDREAMPVGRASRVMGIARCLTSLNPLSPQRA